MAYFDASSCQVESKFRSCHAMIIEINTDLFQIYIYIYIDGFVEQEETPPLDQTHYQPHVVCRFKLWWRPGPAGSDFWLLPVSCGEQAWVWGVWYYQTVTTRPHVQVREMIDRTERRKNIRHDIYFKVVLSCFPYPKRGQLCEHLNTNIYREHELK